MGKETEERQEKRRESSGTSSESESDSSDSSKTDSSKGSDKKPVSHSPSGTALAVEAQSPGEKKKGLLSSFHKEKEEVHKKEMKKGHSQHDLEMSDREHKHLEREVEEEEVKVNIYVRIFMTIMWLGAGAVMILFLYGIVNQLISSYASPGNTISIQQVAVLPLPSVTVCNWNQLVPPLESCLECELSLVSCQNFGNPNMSDCSSLWSVRNWNTADGFFYCYEFNNDPNNVIFSQSVGYSGSMATVWAVKLLPATDPPTNRAAVQATFDIQNSTTADVIYGEISFAPVGFDTFFGLTLVNTVHDELDPSNANYNVSYYQKTASSVALLTPPNDTYAFVGVSFSYQSLSVQYITYDYTYTLLNFFGDFAGMIGTLMGLDVIKVSAGIPVTIVAIRERSLVPLEEHFNG